MTNINTAEMYVCRCDCGEEIVISLRDLEDGKVTSCGCDGTSYYHGLSSLGHVVSSTPITNGLFEHDNTGGKH